MKIFRIIIVLFAIVLVATPIFINLDVLPIRLYDESRLAINASEMNENGNLIVTSFEGKPDMWNTKPPLMIWAQIIFMKIFGVNEWSVRLPAAISGFLTCIVLLVFAIKYLKNDWLGIVSMGILVTSQGYMELHGIRTGDFDALMTLFIILYSLSFFLFIENNNKKYLYLTFLFIALAALTKGIAGMLMLPGLAIYALFRKRAISIFKNRHFYFGLLMMLLLIGWYYLLRENLNPGYLKAVMKNELGGRYLNNLEQSDPGFWFYYDLIRLHHYKEWFVFLLPGFIIGLMTSNKLLRNLVIYSALLVVSYFLIISNGMTKHYWYALPLYPFFALILGAGIVTAINWIFSIRVFSKPAWKAIVPLILLIIVLYEPYRIIIKRHTQATEYAWEVDRYHHVYFLKDALEGKHMLDGYTYVGDGYHANAWFYIFRLRESGQDIKIVKITENAEYSGNIMVFQEEIKQHIKEKYNFEVIDTYFNVELYRIDDKKQLN